MCTPISCTSCHHAGASAPAAAPAQPPVRTTPPQPSFQRAPAKAAAPAAAAPAFDGLDDLGATDNSPLAPDGGEDGAGDAFAMFGDLALGGVDDTELLGADVAQVRLATARILS